MNDYELNGDTPLMATKAENPEPGQAVEPPIIVPRAVREPLCTATHMAEYKVVDASNKYITLARLTHASAGKVDFSPYFGEVSNVKLAATAWVILKHLEARGLYNEKREYGDAEVGAIDQMEYLFTPPY